MKLVAVAVAVNDHVNDHVNRGQRERKTHLNQKGHAGAFGASPPPGYARHTMDETGAYSDGIGTEVGVSMAPRARVLVGPGIPRAHRIVATSP